MRRLAVLALLALLLLQPLWHLLLHPPLRLSPWLVTAIALLPLLVPALGLLRQRPTALFWAGLLALPYFCHGVMEAWSSPGERAIALGEAAVALLLVLAVGANGLAERRRRRAAPDGGVQRL